MTEFIRTVLGDRPTATYTDGCVYAHEHFIIDSPRIALEFPHIHLPHASDAVVELHGCADAGVRLAVDAMPMCAGRQISRLVDISERTGVDLVVATGIHHDRYYGPDHWVNHVTVEALAELMIADLETGIDHYDYTGPIIERTRHRAGIIKIATDGDTLSTRDSRLIEAAALTHRTTGAPILTHCEHGRGGMQQIEAFGQHGVSPEHMLISHADKTEDLGYIRELAQTGAVVGIDQTLRQADRGVASIAVRAVATLSEAGLARHAAVGTDGARRTLWRTLGGSPGLAWLATAFPAVLRSAGVDEVALDLAMRGNAVRVLTWS